MLADFLKRWGLSGGYTLLSNDNAGHLISKLNEALEWIRMVTPDARASHKWPIKRASSALVNWLYENKKAVFFKGWIQRLLSSVFSLLCQTFLSVHPSLSSLFPLILVSTVPFLRLDELINHELPCVRSYAETETHHVRVVSTTRPKCLLILIIHIPFCCSAVGLKKVSSLKY